jgi:hypothetical protein
MKWIIGIDLGTTNCTMATLANTSDSPQITQEFISQRIAENLQGEQTCLPSFLYLPIEEDKQPPMAGLFARERGAEVPDRVIASAKSWLCHDGMDRRKSFLPLGDYPQKKSPVGVSAHFLRHLKDVWQEKYQDNFKNQKIFVTVPASFDPSACQLVQEAIALADFPETILLEEPLAAFYSWLDFHRDGWRKQLLVGDVVLVVDIGGGTTDFSLIRIGEENGNLMLERKAVGSHLLLGGDNFDLTLAHYAQEKFSDSLSEWQFHCLVYACRQAKETLLSDNPPDQVTLTIPGRGNRLIGGALFADFSRKEVESILLNGFFPKVGFEEKVSQEKSAGLAELGLPFVRDPRISAHLAQFLSLSGCSFPTHVLFNGGTLKSCSFCTRLLDVLQEWNAGKKIKELPGADLNFAVSRGAAHYGWLREHQNLRVRAGTSRSYYIGVESSIPSVPGISPPVKAVCVVPFGMEEGSEALLENQTFTLFLGKPVIFRFFSLSHPHFSNGDTPQVGIVLGNWKKELTELHPLETNLDSQGIEEKTVPVKLLSKVTEMGVLELWCVSEQGKKWKLEFNIRKDSV